MTTRKDINLRIKESLRRSGRINAVYCADENALKRLLENHLYRASYKNDVINMLYKDWILKLISNDEDENQLAVDALAYMANVVTNDGELNVRLDKEYVDGGENTAFLDFGTRALDELRDAVQKITSWTFDFDNQTRLAMKYLARAVWFETVTEDTFEEFKEEYDAEIIRFCDVSVSLVEPLRYSSSNWLKSFEDRDFN